MYVLTISCQKGGTGKTTTALAIGAEIYKAGYRVLFADCDPQANLTRAELEKPFTSGLYDVLRGTHKTADAIATGRHGDILPSDGRMAQGGKLAALAGAEPEYRLKRALKAVAGDYDVCIIDTPPTLGEFAIAALIAADGVIVPMRADRYSLYGLQDFYSTFQTVRTSTTNSKLKLLGIILTDYSGRSTLVRDVADAIRQQAKAIKTTVYEPPIRHTVSAQEWQYTGHSSGSTAAKDYEEVTAQIIEDIKLKGRK